MKERFSEKNILLLSALSHLSPAKENFLSRIHLKSFADLFKCEVAKSYILRHINSIRYANPNIVQEICELLYPVRSAFSLVYKIYAAALTFGSTTAVCEASFSTLSQLLAPYIGAG